MKNKKKSTGEIFKNHDTVEIYELIINRNLKNNEVKFRGIL